MSSATTAHNKRLQADQTLPGFASCEGSAYIASFMHPARVWRLKRNPLGGAANLLGGALAQRSRKRCSPSRIIRSRLPA